MALRVGFLEAVFHSFSKNGVAEIWGEKSGTSYADFDMPNPLVSEIFFIVHDRL